MRSNKKLSASAPSAAANCRPGAWWSIAASVLGLFGTSLSAQTPAMAPDFVVNTHTAGDQVRPSIAVGSGGFVVAWQADPWELHGVFGQRYDSMGFPQGTEFQIASDTTYRQEFPKVDMDAAGNFVVVWQSHSEVYGQRFDDSGTPLGGEFQVNTTTPGQVTPSIGVASSGDFMVAWVSWGDGSYCGIFGRRYDSTGTPQGNEFRVNTYTTLGQYSPTVAASASGFVVVWRSDVQDNGSPGIFAQRYDTSGAPQDTEFQVNTESAVAGSETPSVAATDSGGFVVVWTGLPGIFARRYDAAGQPEGEQFRVNTFTGGSQSSPDVALDGSGNFVVVWQTYVFGGWPRAIFGQRYTADGAPMGGEFQVSSETTVVPGLPRVGVDTNGNFVVTWESDTDGSDTGIRARRGSISAAHAIGVDVHGGSGESPNGMMEPGETALIEPAWQNTFSAPLALTGAASNLTGPPGPSYELGDDSADYGTVDSGVTSDCFDATPAHDCYQVTVSGPRPATHWDTTFDETVTNGLTKTWTLHLGSSFSDVPVSDPFYSYIEDVLHNGVTTGCAESDYCPAASVTRAQMAVFLLKSEHGSTYRPPACTGIFEDVPCPSLFADWIEQLFDEGITAGCDRGNYCPDNPVKRQQMAVFLLKAKHGSAYQPPGCGGVFSDVACPSLFANWVEQIYAENITGGCAASPLRYCPTNPNSRGQMAVFLVKTFGLQLYGP